MCGQYCMIYCMIKEYLGESGKYEAISFHKVASRTEGVIVIKMPFDPIERAKEVEKVVVYGGKRKYYRFRYARYYSGIVTADTVGCDLLCAYCWNYFKNLRPEKYGEFYSPKEVAEKLLKIARAKNCYFFRISGAEPILGEMSAKHVAKVISHTGGEFILETNGLMLGYSPELAELFVGLNIVIRVTIKGWDEDSFEKITGSKGEYFHYQLRALETLAEMQIPFWVAVMYDVFREEGVEALRKRLPVPCRIEYEYLEAYPFVLENLRERGIRLRD